MSEPAEEQRDYVIPGAVRPSPAPLGPIAPREGVPTKMIGGPVHWEASCIRCGGPRDARKHPVCDGCTARRQEGLS
jgi:hypothetical protein